MKRLRIRIVGGSLAGLFAGILLLCERSSFRLAARGAGLVGQPDLFRIPRAIGASTAPASVWETTLPQEAAILVDRFAFYVTSGMHGHGYLVPGPKGETGPGERRYNWVWHRPVAPGELQTLFRAADDYSLPRGALPGERLQMLRADAASMLPPPFVKAIEAEPQPSIQGIFDFEAAKIASAHTALIGDAASGRTRQWGSRRLQATRSR